MRYARRLTTDEGNKRLDASTRRACIDPDALSEIKRLLTNSDSGPHGSSPDLKADYEGPSIPPSVGPIVCLGETSARRSRRLGPARGLARPCGLDGDNGV